MPLEIYRKADTATLQLHRMHHLARLDGPRSDGKRDKSSNPEVDRLLEELEESDRKRKDKPRTGQRTTPIRRPTDEPRNRPDDPERERPAPPAPRHIPVPDVPDDEPTIPTPPWTEPTEPDFDIPDQDETDDKTDPEDEQTTCEEVEEGLRAIGITTAICPGSGTISSFEITGSSRPNRKSRKLRNPK